MIKPPCPYIHPPGSRCPACDEGGRYSPPSGPVRGIAPEKLAAYVLLTQELAASGLMVRKTVNTAGNLGKRPELVLLELLERMFSAAVPRESHWTRDKPTRPGWYWIREAGMSSLCHFQVGHGQWWREGDLVRQVSKSYSPNVGYQYASEMDVEFCGPLQAPA